MYIFQRRRQDFGSGGGKLEGVGLVGGPWADHHGRRGIFENFKKIALNVLF